MSFALFLQSSESDNVQMWKSVTSQGAAFPLTGDASVRSIFGTRLGTSLSPAAVRQYEAIPRNSASPCICTQSPTSGRAQREICGPSIFTTSVQNGIRVRSAGFACGPGGRAREKKRKTEDPDSEKVSTLGEGRRMSCFSFTVKGKRKMFRVGIWLLNLIGEAAARHGAADENCFLIKRLSQCYVFTLQYWYFHCLTWSCYRWYILSLIILYCGVLEKAITVSESSVATYCVGVPQSQIYDHYYFLANINIGLGNFNLKGLLRGSCIRAQWKVLAIA